MCLIISPRVAHFYLHHLMTAVAHNDLRLSILTLLIFVAVYFPHNKLN